MSNFSQYCQVYRTSNQAEIISMLEQCALKECSDNSLLIGSRAARHYLPNFRHVSQDENADWDFISSSSCLLTKLKNATDNINTIDMIIPTSNEGDPLDMYVYYTLNNGHKFDVAIPRSSTSYTAYLLNNSRTVQKQMRSMPLENSLNNSHVAVALPRLLLLLKRYMLYYSNQWEKTAKDYRELLTVSIVPIDDETTLIDLIIKYNEKLHGKRPPDTDEFVINATSNREAITISRYAFFQLRKDQQISLIYHVAMSISITDDILIGLEHICTRSPPWLSDFVIENLILIQQDKFNQQFQLSHPRITFEIENHRLFPDIPEIPTKKILDFINDPIDLYSMQLVCKRWYTILRDDSFWKDLCISRRFAYSDMIQNIQSWEILYLLKRELAIPNDDMKLIMLINATITLRKYTTKDVLRLWEDLTHQDQPISQALISKINYILSHAYYYKMDKTSNLYSVGLVIFGLEHERSRVKVILNLRVGEYGASYFSEDIKELSVEIDFLNDVIYIQQFFCPALFGFHILERFYSFSKLTSYLGRDSSALCDQYPSGLLICLFILMVHPDHRSKLITYLKNLEQHCLRLSAIH